MHVRCANVNIKTSDHWTPLQLAIHKSQADSNI